MLWGWEEGSLVDIGGVRGGKAEKRFLLEFVRCFEVGLALAE